ncbi:hypothetical protein IMSAGC019_01960 [Lachnospiraceae bacterium]|nr:hypothetical protein IMSAGC019_01960 [Lachnospiraceae bacterium]
MVAYLGVPELFIFAGELFPDQRKLFFFFLLGIIQGVDFSVDTLKFFLELIDGCLLLGLIRFNPEKP